MNWIITDSADRIYEALDYSDSEKVMIFRYCHKRIIDYTLKMLLQKEWHEGEMKMKTYLINVSDNIDISNDTVRQFKVEDETPQLLIIEKGQCVFKAVNGEILYKNIKQFAN